MTAVYLSDIPAWAEWTILALSAVPAAFITYAIIYGGPKP